MAERVLDALALFTLEKPVWTAESAADALGVSLSTCYRYFASLTEAGLVTTMAPGRFILGPTIIQLDRQLQLTDPLLLAARPVMAGMIGDAPPGSVVLLCSCFGEQVLCIDQTLGEGPQEMVSYQRGRPMPLFRGATSKVLLAHLPGRAQRRLFDAHQAEIAAAGLGSDWPSFRTGLARLRKEAVLVTRAEVDVGRVGIAAPILNEDGQAVGSLSYVILEAEADASRVRRLGALAAAAAGEIKVKLKEADALTDKGQVKIGGGGSL